MSTTRSIRLPILPLWPGLLADTAFWAAAWWLLLLIPRSVARFRRARHGWCLMCGYDLHGVYRAGCPECGWLRDTSPASARNPAPASATSVTLP